MVERRECTLEHVSRGNVGRMNSFLQNAWKGHGVFNFRLKCTLQNQTFLFVQACQEPPTKRAKTQCQLVFDFHAKKGDFRRLLPGELNWSCRETDSRKAVPKIILSQCVCEAS